MTKLQFMLVILLMFIDVYVRDINFSFDDGFHKE